LEALIDLVTFRYGVNVPEEICGEVFDLRSIHSVSPIRPAASARDFGMAGPEVA
jgi:hypothetical protein